MGVVYTYVCLSLRGNVYISSCSLIYFPLYYLPYQSNQVYGFTYYLVKDQYLFTRPIGLDKYPISMDKIVPYTNIIPLLKYTMEALKVTYLISLLFNSPLLLVVSRYVS